MANSKTVAKATISENVISIEYWEYTRIHQLTCWKPPVSTPTTFREGMAAQENIEKTKHTYLFASDSNHLNSWTKTAHHLILQLESYPEKHTNSPAFCVQLGGTCHTPTPTFQRVNRTTLNGSLYPPQTFRVMKDSRSSPPIRLSTSLPETPRSLAFIRNQGIERGGLSWTRGHEFRWHPKHSTRHSFKGEILHNYHTCASSLISIPQKYGHWIIWWIPFETICLSRFGPMLGPFCRYPLFFFGRGGWQPKKIASANLIRFREKDLMQVIQFVTELDPPTGGHLHDQK